MATRDHADYYYVRWSAYATIGVNIGGRLSWRRVDIAGFSIDYALDRIPEATILPTIGREPRSGKEAKAVDAFLQARPYTAVEIFLRGETAQDSPHGAPFPGFLYNTDMKVFSGFYQGMSYGSMRSPAGGQVRLEANVAGWLSALAGSSVRTNVTAVKGPGGFAEAANLGGDSPTFFDLQSTISESLEGAVTDLWLDFIKPFFEGIVSTPALWGDSDNTSAARALAAMDAKKVFPGPKGAADNHLPLRVGGEAIGEPDLARFIVMGLAWQVFNSWRNSDMWSALLELAGLFTFHIVPLIDTATCAPVYGPLGGAAYVTIDTSEYDHVSIAAQTSALISKYVVYNPLGGMSSPYDTTPRTSVITGIFSADQLWVTPGFPARGITVSEPAPSWLAGEIARGDITRLSIGGDRGGIPDAVNPTAFAEEPAADYQQIYNNYQTSDVGDRYAKTKMQDLLLRNRRGTVRGRFRLDVCPGSLVNVQVIEDKWQPEGEPQSILGMVKQVSLQMGAAGAGSSGQASTTFWLTHVRSAQEHTGIGEFLTSPEHPIFERRFVGARLWS